MPTSGTPSGPPPQPVVVPKQAFSLTISSGAVFAASVLIQVLGLIGSIVLIKQTTKDTALVGLVGAVQLFLLIASSINGVGDLRLGTAYTYFLARGKPARDNTATYLFVRMGMVAVAAFVLFVLAPISIGGNQIVSGNQEYLAFGLFMALPLLWSFSTVYNSMFIGEGNSLRAQYPSLVEALARLPFLFYVAYHDFTILGMTLAYVAGAVASTLFSLPAVYKRMSKFKRTEATRVLPVRLAAHGQPADQLSRHELGAPPRRAQPWHEIAVRVPGRERLPDPHPLAPGGDIDPAVSLPRRLASSGEV